ncbi:uncharacterized protein LOC126836698 [Adelges cooleyi]|uniref:uncharacterized protein LOC126836698 n=1 Tax=Adelges cooleyi TaxID=133065 RepID=UPI00217F4166|nr:uncharacterized protein LOC126836698 [Adelges cooleyi]
MANKKKSNKYCCVFGCNSYYSINTNLSFHQFPNLKEPKVLWKNKIGIEELINRRRMWAIILKLSKKALKKKQLKVCSKHFNECDFFPMGLNKTRICLKPTAIPSQNLPKFSVLLPSPKKRPPPKNKTPKQLLLYGKF